MKQTNNRIIASEKPAAANLDEESRLRNTSVSSTFDYDDDLPAATAAIQGYHISNI